VVNLDFNGEICIYSDRFATAEYRLDLQDQDGDLRLIDFLWRVDCDRFDARAAIGDQHHRWRYQSTKYVSATNSVDSAPIYIN
jgi:hypothetical protein